MYKFVRCTKLHNIAGRAGYITSEKAQEEIVLQSEPVDWKPYADFEIANQRTKEKNNQGRELVIALPNKYADLYFLKDRIDMLVELTVGKTTDVQWAVHWNKSRTNLHVHIIFSERTRVPEAERKVYDRDVYLTEDGKVARNKAQRARDENGNIKPPVHRKGEMQGEFSAKDTRYKQKGWLEETKNKVIDHYKQWGIEIDEQGLLHQHHVPKGAPESLVQKNEAIKQINQNYKILLANPKAKQKDIDRFTQEAIKAAKMPSITMNKVLSGVPQRNIFERAVEGISDAAAERSARKAEEAARRLAEEQAKRAAEEAARKVAEQQAAAEQARREAARAAQQQRLADIAAVKKECERRIETLNSNIVAFRKLDWNDFEATRALNRMAGGSDELPVPYVDIYGKMKMTTFTPDEIQEAKEFINQTRTVFDTAVKERKEAISAFRSVSLDDRLKDANERYRKQKDDRPEPEKRKNKDDREL